MKRWPTKPLREFCEFRHGSTPSKAQPNNWNGSFPWVSPKDMKVEVILDTEDHLSQEAIVDDRATIAKKNSLLVVVRSGILAHTFPVAIAGRDVAFNQDLKSLRVVVSTIVSRYLFRFLQASSRQILAQGTKRGPTVHSLRSGFLESLPIPVPPLAEQERIVELLDEADELRKLRAQADQRTTSLIPAIFDEMFGDPSTNLKGWPVRSVEEIAVNGNRGITTGPFGTQLGSKDFTTEGPEVFGIYSLGSANSFRFGGTKRISSKKFNELAKYNALPDDVLISRMGTVGKICVVPKDAPQGIVSYHLIRVRLLREQCDPQYFAQLLSVAETGAVGLSQSAKGAIMRGINATIVSSFRVPVPPLPLQKEFARLVNEVRGLEPKQATSRHRLEDFFQCLLQRAFQGEL
jgi:type I restriction enzyme S subunit